MMGAYCFLNGRIVLCKRAGMPLNDLGVLRGYGVFDFLRTYNKKPFLMKEHLDRLEQSARRLHLAIPVPREDIEKAVYTLIRKNAFPETSLRFVLTGGISATGFFPEEKPTFFILAEKSEAMPEYMYQRGISVVTHEYLRDIPEAKTNNYMIAVKMRNLKKNKRFVEMLYMYQGNILEATTSNIFFVKGNTLITPKKNILVGTTRNFVIRLARKDFRIEERDVHIDEIKQVSEAFLTATNKEILPVVRINKYVIGDGKVGLHTKELMSRFRAHTASLK
ncbi:MAG: amino acid aminotransferase [Candidatus Niyogibacteria bacterium CG10_big_fil_rev_8_21_14_0_10_46_36]|uniref:Amino acid aminotransferase n=1 Tax=Candidatus Niyogibacteria bacterium CG10_big_fil_rev_8_21_14_0_10_46_36 TaxID=1974726 RepID=A0A2H0TCW1_9BACT|nr:MAG: amino acid aminotransferase [Candidatus Niyogibacteria bacterium CG10_big_fil_rev_8_21_14_0_10_46_36]